MKQWKMMALGTAVAVSGAALMVLGKKLAEKQPAAGKKAAVSAAPAKKAVPTKAGVYSFVSGFKDAATVEVELQYDPANYSFAVVEDEFFAESSDSHVAIVNGPQVDFQLEYAAYVGDESFVDLIREIESRHSGFSGVVYGENSGVSYPEGDALCLCFPAGEDAHSYLLITAKPGAENDDGVAALIENEDLKAMLSSIRVTRS